LISASSLPLLVECAATGNPNTWQAPDKTNDGMRFGNAVHKLAEWYLTSLSTVAATAAARCGLTSDDVPRLERVWENLRAWLEVERSGDLGAEAAYALCPSTGGARLLGYGIDREYEKAGLLPSEIAGTADAWCIEGDHAYVYDWKSGKAAPESYRWQMRLLGLMVARATGAKTVTICVVKVTEVEVDDSWSEELDASDLDDIAAEVRRVWNEAQTGQARAGSHCEAQYCRARNKCRAYRDWRAA
jgi:hypothetical protein